MSDAPSHMICAVWGPLDNGCLVHMDCPVVVRARNEGIAGSPARTENLPIVCACECQTCKRAWWGEGRPVVRDGTVMTDGKPKLFGGP